MNLLNAITAGIAANKPNAVAINASEIPGATAFMAVSYTHLTLPTNREV